MTPAERLRPGMQLLFEDLLGQLGAFPEPPTFVDRLVLGYLEAILRDLDAALAGTCPEDPTRLTGAPLGQYHCPACDCMVLAGVPHLPHDDGCRLGLNEEET